METLYKSAIYATIPAEPMTQKIISDFSDDLIRLNSPLQPWYLPIRYINALIFYNFKILEGFLV